MTDNIEEQLRQAVNEALDSGWSCNALAQRIGVAQPTLHRFSKNERPIGFTTAAKIAEAFGMRLTKAKAIRPE